MAWKRTNESKGRVSSSFDDHLSLSHRKRIAPVCDPSSFFATMIHGRKSPEYWGQGVYRDRHTIQIQMFVVSCSSPSQRKQRKSRAMRMQQSADGRSLSLHWTACPTMHSVCAICLAAVCLLICASILWQFMADQTAATAVAAAAWIKSATPEPRFAYHHQSYDTVVCQQQTVEWQAYRQTYDHQSVIIPIIIRISTHDLSFHTHSTTTADRSTRYNVDWHDDPHRQTQQHRDENDQAEQSKQPSTLVRLVIDRDSEIDSNWLAKCCCCCRCRSNRQKRSITWIKKRTQAAAAVAGRSTLYEQMRCDKQHTDRQVTSSEPMKIRSTPARRNPATGYLLIDRWRSRKYQQSW